jgi:hypothetical protein
MWALKIQKQLSCFGQQAFANIYIVGGGGRERMPKSAQLLEGFHGGFRLY